jgi:cell division transport system permease protein
VENSVLSSVKTIKRKKKLGAYPSLSVVFSITLAVLVIGVLGIVLVFYQSESDIIKKHITIHVYLDIDVPQEKTDSIRTYIASQKFVLVQDGKSQIKYITKEEAAKKFIQETGEDFSKLLGDNPLPDALKASKK